MSHAWIDILREAGFAPTGQLGQPFVEFERRYFDPATGHHYRALAQIDRKTQSLNGFVISVIAAIPATRASAERAPEIMRDDLYALASLVDVPEPPAPVHTMSCDVCGCVTNKYIPVATPNGPQKSVVLCLSCYDPKLDKLALRVPETVG